MMKALKGLSLFGGLAVVLTLFLVIGCSNFAPLQPDNPNSVELGKLDKKLMSSEEESESEPLVVYDSKLIDKDEGGIIVVDRLEHSHEFEVQPNALEENTLITIRSVNEEVLGKEMIVFEFGPDGLEFGRSSKLRFEMAELSAVSNTAYLYYYDSEKEQWVSQGSITVDAGIAEFDIDHFSKYAISD